MTDAQAILSSAREVVDEEDRGSLAPGKLADLVVLDRDAFTEGPDSLLEARVMRTVVAGRVVYEA
jgi:predicted amidohydrolase YtcJ